MDTQNSQEKEIMKNDWTDYAIGMVMVILFVTLVGLVIGLCYALYSEFYSEKFYLRKDEWSCSKVYEHQTAVITHKDCIQWDHK